MNGRQLSLCPKWRLDVCNVSGSGRSSEIFLGPAKVAFSIFIGPKNFHWETAKI